MGVSYTIDRESFERRIVAEGVGSGVLVVDLMNLSFVDDVDTYLTEIARRVAAVLRSDDRVDRISREQVAVTVPTDRPAELALIAERLEAAISGQEIVVGPRVHRGYAAVGWAGIESPGGDALWEALERTAARVQERSRRLLNESPLRSDAPQDAKTLEELAHIVVTGPVEQFHAAAADLRFDDHRWSFRTPAPVGLPHVDFPIEIHGVQRGNLRAWMRDPGKLRPQFISVVVSFLNESFERVLALELGRSDPLTGLPNRAGLQSELDHAPPTALALLDADRFKAINDQHGYATGDRVLVELANVVRHGCHPWTTGRWGGEEFVVAGTCDPADLRDRLLSVLDTARATIEVASGSPVTFSAGVVRVGPLGSRAALEDADSVLKVSKQTRGTVTVR